MKCLMVWLKGFVRSPIISHNWAIVWTPTRRMTKSPTNLTEKAQPKNAPVMLNHVHHSGVNSAWLKFLNLAIAKVAPDMKNIRIGSRRMYWFKVIIPTSEINKAIHIISNLFDTGINDIYQTRPMLQPLLTLSRTLWIPIQLGTWMVLNMLQVKYKPVNG